MDHNTILSRLDNGWELANRGRGWWLSEPRIPYRRCESFFVETKVVEELQKAGLITMDLPYKTLFARPTVRPQD